MLAKRAAACPSFVLLYSIWAVLLWLPAAAWIALVDRPEIGPKQWLAFLATGLLHVAYSTCLQRGYQVADLSVVYPLARGTGPLVSFVGAIILLGERPSVAAAGGALLVVAGVFLLASGGSPHRDRRKGVFFGVATGLLIASYTVLDGFAVKALLIPPLLLDFAGNVIRCVALSRRALLDRKALLDEHRRYWKEALGVAVLGPLGYILVLHATRLSSVSRVAPARELSMMVGAYLGAKLLGEGDGKRRLLASGLIACGVLALALG